MSMPLTCASPVMPGRTLENAQLPAGLDKIGLRGHARPRADQTHITEQHVPELREFVDLETAQMLAKRGDR